MTRDDKAERLENGQGIMQAMRLGCGTEIADDAIEHDYAPRWIDSGRGGTLSLWDCDDVWAINTNGGAVWEHQDGFCELLAQINPALTDGSCDAEEVEA